MNPSLKRMNRLLFIAGLFNIAIAPPLQAQTLSPASQCYNAALTFGASERDRDRATYLCDEAISTAPAQCYWQALGFGASVKAQDRAARLCRRAGHNKFALSDSRSIDGNAYNPAQCYWDSLSFGASRRNQYQVLSNCSAEPILEIPLEVKECAITTQQRLRVSRSSALLACSNAFNQQ